MKKFTMFLLGLILFIGIARIGYTTVCMVKHIKTGVIYSRNQ